MRTAAQPLGDSWRRRDGAHAHGRAEVREGACKPRDQGGNRVHVHIRGWGPSHCTLEGQHGIRRMNAICLLAIPQDQCYGFFRVAPVSSTAPLVTRLRCGGGLRARALLVDLVIPFIHSLVLRV